MYAPSPTMHRGATIGGIIVPRGDMKRRDFIQLVGGACGTARIEILANDRILTDPHGAPIWRAFFEELAAGGFIEGSNLQVVRRGFGLTDLDAAVNELVRARPDVVFALATPAAHAVKLATRSIPLVAMADDLVGSGLVGSMAHPEGNVTGVAIFA